ncbi:hypothetical protein TNCT_407661 [Trichonephila clavata]|uniref:Uncharacterized protein n=1 Tax=Trichonephila clavata TaxID=2740835 RepID=A0A8X6G8D6_TRICU|nr:hypothetical protein TNCT_407661 [Trichonephila clavata]
MRGLCVVLPPHASELIGKDSGSNSDVNTGVSFRNNIPGTQEARTKSSFVTKASASSNVSTPKPDEKSKNISHIEHDEIITIQKRENKY